MVKTAEEKHPDPKQIERFVRGEASPAENRALVSHLAHGCPRCQKLARQHWASVGTDDQASGTTGLPARPRRPAP